MGMSAVFMELKPNVGSDVGQAEKLKLRGTPAAGYLSSLSTVQQLQSGEGGSCFRRHNFESSFNDPFQYALL